MIDSSWLWALFTVLAAAGQTARNAMQRELTTTLGTVGATHVRFLFGFPFALIFLLGVALASGIPLPRPGLNYIPWLLCGALAQIAATTLMLAAMGERSFVVGGRESAPPGLRHEVGQGLLPPPDPGHGRPRDVDAHALPRRPVHRRQEPAYLRPGQGRAEPGRGSCRRTRTSRRTQPGIPHASRSSSGAGSLGSPLAQAQSGTATRGDTWPHGAVYDPPAGSAAMSHPLVWLVCLLVPLVAWLALLVALRGRLGALYRRYFGEARRERLFLSTVAFYVTFAAVRGITHAIRAGVGPFHDVAEGGVHIHHLVWGILLLLGVGYLWLLQIGAGDAGESRPLSRLTAVLYGIGAALTLDEFALWLNLRDVYWAREGRESVDAVLLFSALLSTALLGGPFFRALARALARLGGRP